MKINFLYFLVFVCGLVSQAFSMLMGKWKPGDFKKITLSLSTGLLGLLPGKDERSYDLRLHLIFACVIAVFSFTATFRKRLITFIGARTLIVLNIITLFLIYYKFGFSYWVFGLLAIPSIITLINGFTNIDKYFSWQVFFYSWFSIMIIIISFIHFSFGNLIKIFGWSEMGGEISYVGIFLSGAAFFYIASNIWYIVQLIPDKEKNESIDDRIFKIKKHMHLLAYGYVWEKDDFKGNLIILIVLPIITILNHQFDFFSDILFISFTLAILPVSNYFKNNPKMTGDGVGHLNAQVQKIDRYDKKLFIIILNGIRIILISVFIIAFVYYFKEELTNIFR